MSSSVLRGRGREFEEIPFEQLVREISRAPRQIKAELGFMTDDHHRVRNFAVRELPRLGRPLTPRRIAESLRLPVDRVHLILDELEKHLTFLFRNDAGAVAWAYPMTVDPTPHRLTFSTGEKTQAA